MARIIIGAGAGYYAALLMLAIQGNLFFHTYFLLKGPLGFVPAMLAPILVGAVMGWAWDNIVSGDGPKDD